MPFHQDAKKFYYIHFHLVNRETPRYSVLKQTKHPYYYLDFVFFDY